MGKPIIMGRKTWKSIGRPLPGRPNVVISRDPNYAADGIDVVQSVEQAFARARELGRRRRGGGRVRHARGRVGARRRRRRPRARGRCARGGGRDGGAARRRAPQLRGRDRGGRAARRRALDALPSRTRRSIGRWPVDPLPRLAREARSTHAEKRARATPEMRGPGMKFLTHVGAEIH